MSILQKRHLHHFQNDIILRHHVLFSAGYKICFARRRRVSFRSTSSRSASSFSGFISRSSSRTGALLCIEIIHQLPHRFFVFDTKRNLDTARSLFVLFAIRSQNRFGIAASAGTEITTEKCAIFGILPVKKFHHGQCAFLRKLQIVKIGTVGICVPLDRDQIDIAAYVRIAEQRIDIAAEDPAELFSRFRFERRFARGL